MRGKECMRVVRHYISHGGSLEGRKAISQRVRARHVGKRGDEEEEDENGIERDCHGRGRQTGQPTEGGS